MGFLLTYDRDIKDPLILLQESPLSMRVVRGLSGFLSSRCLVLGTHQELRSNSEFLSSADMHLGIPQEFPQG